MEVKIHIEVEMKDVTPGLSAGDILAAGRTVQQGRIRLISENIANARSTANTPGGDPYQRKIAVFQPVNPDADGSPSLKVARDKTAFPNVYSPGNIAAGPQGYVKFPNVNVAVESADLQSAIRAYEMNLSASKQLNDLDKATSDLLR